MRHRVQIAVDMPAAAVDCRLRIGKLDFRHCFIKALTDHILAATGADQQARAYKIVKKLLKIGKHEGKLNHYSAVNEILY